MSDNDPGVAWSPEGAHLLVQHACAAAGMEEHGTTLLRFGTNAVYHLDGTPWVLRLTRPGIPPAAIQRQVDLARWLVQQGFPANRPADVDVVTAALGGATATFWEYVETIDDGRVDVDVLGKLLRTFHDLTDSYPKLDATRAWDPLIDIDDRLATAREDRWLAPDDLAVLFDWRDRLRAAVSTLQWALRPGLLHGDAHTGNVLRGPDGPVVIDLDALSIGPREWDLVPTCVSILRFRRDTAAVDRFGAAYGFDVRAWSGWPTLQKLRELYMTCWLISVASDDARRDEVRHRMAYWRNPTDDVVWHAV